MTDSTRAMILIELGRAGELTATQLARRLGLTANNVYHHMRILRRLGVVPPPRSVPGTTFVEKYYRIGPEIRSALQADPEWLDHATSSMTPEDRKAIMISMCITMAHLLHRAARRYGAMDPVELDTLARDKHLAMMSINEVSRPRLEARLAAIREVMARESEQFVDEDSDTTDVVLIATLPLLWEEPAIARDSKVMK
jgi:DNA-binding transcriptional ArsR family regulator